MQHGRDPHPDPPDPRAAPGAATGATPNPAVAPTPWRGFVVRGLRLAVTLDLPAALRSLPVPPLLLQPLVENAIQHGLEPQRELLPRLDPRQFWQVHRGLVVRAAAVTTALRDESGKVFLQLRGGPERLTASQCPIAS